MATSSTVTRPATGESSEAGAHGGMRMAATGSLASNAAGAAADAAGEVAAQLPHLAERGRAAYEDANRTIQAGTDEMLTVGTALSFGFAVGLLIGGATRILVAAALVPVAMMGFTLLDRAARGRLGTGTTGTTRVDR